MKYLCLIYVDDARLALMPRPVFRQVIDECRCNEERLRENGQLLAAHALEPVDTATTLRHAGRELAITDGPFAETKEVLAGYNLIEADSLEQAIELASRFPWARYGSMEVRPVADMEAERERVGA